MIHEIAHLPGWLILLLIFPGAALGCAAIIHSEDKREVRRTSLPRGGTIPILIGVGLTYLLALAHVFYDPYWDDNGAKTAMFFPQHLMWAWMEAMILQVLVIPVTVMLCRLVVSACKGRARLPR